MARSRIKDMMAGGSPAEYEFSGGAYPYSLKWCDLTRPHVTITDGVSTPDEGARGDCASLPVAAAAGHLTPSDPKKA